MEEQKPGVRVAICAVQSWFSSFLASPGDVIDTLIQVCTECNALVLRIALVRDRQCSAHSCIRARYPLVPPQVGYEPIAARPGVNFLGQRGVFLPSVFGYGADMTSAHYHSSIDLISLYDRGSVFWTLRQGRTWVALMAGKSSFAAAFLGPSPPPAPLPAIALCSWRLCLGP